MSTTSLTPPPRNERASTQSSGKRSFGGSFGGSHFEYRGGSSFVHPSRRVTEAPLRGSCNTTEEVPPSKITMRSSRVTAKRKRARSGENAEPVASSISDFS